MKPESITLISFGYFGKKYPEEIYGDIEKQFMLPVILREGYLDLSVFFDPARKQYDGNRLLREIELRYATHQTKTLGIFNVDLYIPILTFIFGQAFLNGKCGIASAYRLKNELYGIKADEKRFVSRLKKEVIHELGHLFGLIHCHTVNCVMRSSTYVEDIDQKNWSFCPSCQNILSGNMDLPEHPQVYS